MAMTYDAAHHRVVAFDAMGVTHAYEGHAWHVLPVDDSPAPRLFMMIYDPWSERVVLFASNEAERSTMWWLDETGWRRTELLGAQPGFRVRPGFAALPSQRALVLFGGSGYDDTWLLRYVSQTPDEDCANAGDDDGDYRIDADDPDCSFSQ